MDASMGNLSQRHVLADAWVVRSSELGVSSDGDDMIHCRTHLGHLLHPGDVALGYDLRNSNANDAEFEKMKRGGVEFADVVLVKKVYADKGSRIRRRKWKLKHLDRQVDDDASSAGDDYEDFLQDLEEDETIRQGVNIFVDKEKLDREMSSGAAAPDEDHAPEISLAEMMEDLEINDDPMGDDDNEEEEDET